MADLSALDTDDQLSYWVGRIARNDVIIESNLIGLNRSLEVFVPKAKRKNVQNGFERWREEAKSRVKLSHLPTDVVKIGLNLLGDVKTVHGERVHMVHDLWLRMVDAPEGTFVAGHLLMGNFEKKVQPQTLEELSGAHAKQLLQSYRLHLFTMALTLISTHHFIVADGDQDEISRNQALIDLWLDGAKGGLKMIDDEIHFANKNLARAVAELSSY